MAVGTLSNGGSLVIFGISWYCAVRRFFVIDFFWEMGDMCGVIVQSGVFGSCKVGGMRMPR